MIGTEPATDEELVLAYSRRGDRRALESLVERHFSSAYRLALRMLGDPGAAEDAAEEVFIGLIRGARRFEEGRPFGPWFSTLVLNTVRKAARSRRRRDHHERAAAANRGREASASSALEQAEVEAHVARLPLDVRLPVVLHYYEGLTHERVAELTGCPKATATSRIRRGLEQLRESLVGAGYGGVTVVSLEDFLGRPRPRPPAPARPSLARLESTAAKAQTFALLAKAGIVLALVLAAGTTVAVRTPPPPALAGAESKAPAEPDDRGADRIAAASTTEAPAEAPALVSLPATAAATAPAPAPAGAPPGPSAAVPVSSSKPLLEVVVKDSKGALVPSALLHVEPIEAGARRVDDKQARMEGILQHLHAMPEDSVHVDAKGHGFVHSADLRPGDRVMVYGGRGSERAMVGPVTLSESPLAHVDVVLRPLDEPEPGYGTILIAVSKEGAPLAGSSVQTGWTFKGTDRRLTGQIEDTFRADGAGVVAFRDVPPGHHVFLVSSEGTAPARVELDLAEGTVEKREAALGAEGILLGHVLAPAGAPVASTDVSAEPVAKEKGADTGTPLRARVEPDGSYEVKGLGAGKHVLHARLDGYATRTVEVEVAPGSQPGPDLRLGAGATLSGTVLRGTAPAAGRAIRIQPAGRSEWFSEDDVTTDDLGKWSLRGLAPGRWSVHITVAAGERFKSDLEVDVGEQDVDVGEITISKAAGDLRGRVVGEDDRPLEGAEVVIVQGLSELPEVGGVRPSGPGAPEPKRAPHATRTDKDGRFSFEGLEKLTVPGSGEVAVVAHAKGLVCEAIWVKLGGPDVLLRAVRAGRVVGRIRAPKLLLGGGQVQLGNEPVALEADGSFEQPGVVPGETWLFVTTPTLTLRKPGIVVKAGEETRVDVSLEPTGSLEVDVKGAPEGANTSISVDWGDERSLSGTVRSDRRTGNEPIAVPAGPAKAWVSIFAGAGSGFVILGKPAVVVAGTTTKVQLEWPADTGVVKGKAVAGGYVILQRDGVDAHARVRDDGSYELTLPAGTYSAHVDPPGGTEEEHPAAVPVTIEAGKTTDPGDMPVARAPDDR